MKIANAATSRQYMRSRVLETSQLAPARPNSLLFLILILIALGLLMMTSSSIEIAYLNKGDAYFYLKRQGVFLLLGLAAMLVTLHLPMKLWQRLNFVCLLVAFVLLIVVLTPLGTPVKGSARWIDLGLFNLQPSELAKIFAVFYLANYLSRHGEQVRQKVFGFIVPLFVLAAMAGLLYMEPDHGALVIIMLTGLCLIFIAGANMTLVTACLIAGSAAIYQLATLKSHALDRLISFRDPFAPDQIYGDGYQLAQALIAIGRGDWFGLGLGNSIQKQHFLPEAHNDFVLAITGEEFGIVGILLVLALFSLFVVKAMHIARLAQKQGQTFSAYVAYGIALLFAGQVMVSVGVNIGLLPTKGLTLPFFSYGGASLIISCFMAALLLRIQYEAENPAVTRAKKGSQSWLSRT